jgi:hypothetical protein
VLAAPFAALITRRVPDRALMLLVGAVIVLLSSRRLLQNGSGQMARCH